VGYLAAAGRGGRGDHSVPAPGNRAPVAAPSPATSIRARPDPLWQELADTAIDLGYVWSTVRTPRQVVIWLRREGVRGEADGALQTLAGAVEVSRYAAPRDGVATQELVTDLRRVEVSLRRRAAVGNGSGPGYSGVARLVTTRRPPALTGPATRISVPTTRKLGWTRISARDFVAAASRRRALRASAHRVRGCVRLVTARWWSPSEVVRFATLGHREARTTCGSRDRVALFLVEALAQPVFHAGRTPGRRAFGALASPTSALRLVDLDPSIVAAYTQDATISMKPTTPSTISLAKRPTRTTANPARTPIEAMMIQRRVCTRERPRAPQRRTWGLRRRAPARSAREVSARVRRAAPCPPYVLPLMPGQAISRAACDPCVWSALG